MSYSAHVVATAASSFCPRCSGRCHRAGSDTPYVSSAEGTNKQHSISTKPGINLCLAQYSTCRRACSSTVPASQEQIYLHLKQILRWNSYCISVFMRTGTDRLELQESQPRDRWRAPGTCCRNFLTAEFLCFSFRAWTPIGMCGLSQPQGSRMPCTVVFVPDASVECVPAAATAAISSIRVLSHKVYRTGFGLGCASVSVCWTQSSLIAIISSRNTSSWACVKGSMVFISNQDSCNIGRSSAVSVPAAVTAGISGS